MFPIGPLIAAGTISLGYDGVNMNTKFPYDFGRAASFVQALLLLAGMTLLLSRPGWAEENQATISAFEALLSLPQTQPPEGGWEHQAPPGFVVEDNNEEAALISWLKEQKRMGADLNAMRHGGTMLHHAIRAGMVDTVSWLLASGADPLKEGEHDALELAVVRLQKDVFHLLIKRPGVLDANRNGLYLTWWRILNDGLDGEIETLVNARVPLPAGKNRQRLLDDALRAGNIRLIRALADPNTERVLVAKARSVDEDIEAADRALPNPVFPALIGHVASVGEVDRLFRVRIRRPFDDAAFAADVVSKTLWKALFRPAPTPAATMRVFERLPAPALQAAFKDENVLSMWWRWQSRLPAGHRSVAMAWMGDLPQREPEALLKATIKGASWFDQNEKNPDAAAAWGELLASLRSPLPEGVQGKLWMFVPQAHRLALLRLGYRPSSEELRWWVDRSTPEIVRAFWPTILSIRPEIGRKSHELIFRPFADGSDYYCVDHWTVEKTLPLTIGAMAPERPYKMEAGCWYAESETVRQKLVAKGWVSPPPNVTTGRIVLDQQRCAFRPTAAWRRALAGLRSLTTTEGESISIDAVIPVAVPGERNCVLLAWGGNAGGRRFIDDDSFEGTQRLTPCADGNYVVAIWRLKGEQFDSALQKDLPFPGGMTLIRDSSDGRQFWLGGNEGLGGCGQTPPELFQFDQVDGRPALLRALPKTHPTMQALLSQCQGKDLLECLGDNPSPDGGEQRAYPEQTSGLGYFADVHWTSERKAFIDAVLDFKPDVLNAMKSDGIFPHWVTDALVAVSASSLSLAEKRRRTAWLFRDRPMLRAAMESQMLNGLVDWLPREDWGPIIKEGPEHLRSLRYTAVEKNKPALACRFATALKQPCGRKED